MSPAEYKAEREKRGTQKEVASLLGVSRVTIARRETGTRPVIREAWLALLALQKQTPDGVAEPVVPNDLQSAYKTLGLDPDYVGKDVRPEDFSKTFVRLAPSKPVAIRYSASSAHGMNASQNSPAAPD